MKPGVTVKPLTYCGWKGEGVKLERWRSHIPRRAWALVTDSVMKQRMSHIKLLSDRRLETPFKPQGAHSSVLSH